MASPKSERKKKRLGGIPFFGVFFSMTLALFVLGLFSLLMLLANNLTSEIKQNVEIQVFLQKNITHSEIIAIRSTISGMDFVAKEDNRPRITFVSKEQAAEEFSKDIGEDFVHYIGENPLSDLLIVRVSEDHQSPEHFRSIKAKVESLRGVLEATYAEKLIENIHNNLTKISLILVSLMCLFFVAVVIIIYHSLRLALFSQRFLIRSMQLVGATDRFIKRPFLIRATLYAFLSASAACSSLYGLLILTKDHIEYINILHHQNHIVLLFASVLSVGLLTSYFGTKNAIERYLRMSLDDLY